MLSDIASSPQIIEMMCTNTPENDSETDPSQNGKKSSYENLKKKIALLKKRRNKSLLAGLILVILLTDLFYKIFNKEKR